jgi:hypothetical protein
MLLIRTTHLSTPPHTHARRQVTPWVDDELKVQLAMFGDAGNMYGERMAANRPLYGLTEDRCTALLARCSALPSLAANTP